MVVRPLSRTSRTSRQLPEIPAGAQGRRSPSLNRQLSIETRTITPDIHRARSLSRHSSDRRPLGPRSPSPLPPRTPSPLPSQALSPTLPSLTPQAYVLDPIPSFEADLAHEATLVNSSESPNQSPGLPVTPRTPRIPRSKRQPFEPTENLETTPKADLPVTPQTTGVVIEPLSIKKKTSVTSSTRSSPPRSRPSSTQTVRASPKSPKSPRGKRGSVRKAPSDSSSSTPPALPALPVTGSSEEIARLVRRVETTKEDVSVYADVCVHSSLWPGGVLQASCQANQVGDGQIAFSDSRGRVSFSHQVNGSLHACSVSVRVARQGPPCHV